jgi:hypothetical protein
LSQSSLSQYQSDLLALNSPAQPTHPANVVTAQTPQPGRRVLPGDSVHVTLAAVPFGAAP